MTLFSVVVLIGLVVQLHGNPTFNEGASKNWAVLVAGSNGWDNYRHQSDIFHAYQILKKNGIPEENIITFAYDDIARHRHNPYPGKVFNDYKHKDVYAGVKIDYKGDSVTPKIFLKALQGDKSLEAAGKKVLKSGPNDHVFIYFSDHGAPNLIAFPNGHLYAREFARTLQYMHDNKMYQRMVLYIEACYSGSMFKGLLPVDIEIYATTAANEKQSSYAAFCSDKTIDTCLSDQYSHNWMEDSEKHDLARYTLDDQFKQVKKDTTGSEVCKFGSGGIGALPAGEFQGQKKAERVDEPSNVPMVPLDVHLASKAHLHAKSRRMVLAKTEAEHDAASRRLQRALQLGHMVKEVFEDIVLEVTTKMRPTVNAVTRDTELDCYEAAFDQFSLTCFKIQQIPEVAKYAENLVQLCRSGYAAKDIIQSIEHTCS